MSSEAVWARNAALSIWDRLVARDFAGWDPYDALNARWLPGTIKNARPCRRILTQLVKRSPLPLQPILGVQREVDAYTLGHVLLAGARLARTVAVGTQTSGDAADPEISAVFAQVVTRLRSMAQIEGSHSGWGYHFPVYTRFFSYVPPTPNLIVTAFVAKGMAAVTRAGLVDCTADLQGAAAFILEGLPCVTDETGQCIGYVPNENTVVHNANMLAAMVLCEVAEVAADAENAANAGATARLLDAALACARYTAARQAADGSWPYSEESYGRWVDGFHTGFVLEGLARVVKASGDEGLRTALERGLRYYVAQLFGPEGEPKYYPHKPYPFDALSATQGVETLHVVLGDSAAHAVPGQLDWIRRHLIRPDGRVAYQVHRGWTDRREFPRWSSAPLMSALAGVAAASASAAPAIVAPSRTGGTS